MAKRPRWRIVYDHLRAAIDHGDLRPGDKIPTELELSDNHGFSRPTIREAIRRLEQDGLLTAAVPGAGRAVKDRAPITFNLTRFELAYDDDPTNQIDQWGADAHAEGWQTRQIVAGVDEMLAPVEIAHHLQCPPGQHLLRRRRLRYVSKDGVPEQLAMIADTWTPLDIANITIDGIAPLRATDNVVYPGGIYRALGFHQVMYHDEIQVRMPTPEEADLLDQDPGTPVGQHVRVGVDKSGRRLRVLLSVFSGDRQRLRYDLPIHELRTSDR